MVLLFLFLYANENKMINFLVVSIWRNGLSKSSLKLTRRQCHGMLYSKVGERVEVKLHTGLSKKEFRTLKQRNPETFSLFQFHGALVLFFSSMDPHVKTAYPRTSLPDHWREAPFKLFLVGHNNLVYAEIIHDQVEHLRERIYVAMSTVTPQMLQDTWLELYYLLYVYCSTGVADIETFSMSYHFYDFMWMLMNK